MIEQEGLSDFLFNIHYIHPPTKEGEIPCEGLTREPTRVHHNTVVQSRKELLAIAKRGRPKCEFQCKKLYIVGDIFDSKGQKVN